MPHGESQNGPFNGLYLGTVVSNSDPIFKNRTKVMIPGVYDETTTVDDLPYADFCTNTFGIGHGPIAVPSEGCTVWVMFRQGHAEYPIIMGGQIIDRDSTQGTKAETIDGNHHKLVTGTSESITGGRIRETIGNETHTVSGESSHSYHDLDFIVLDQVKYTYGRKHEAVSGGSTEEVSGSKIISILGSRKQDISGSIDDTVGGDQRSFILGVLALTAGNLMGSPTKAGIALTATNSLAEFKAVNLAGITGSKLELDSLGLQTSLTSLVAMEISSNLSMEIDATLIRIGKLAFQPAVLPAHTHIGNLGYPTGPVIPIPKISISTKVFIE